MKNYTIALALCALTSSIAGSTQFPMLRFHKTKETLFTIMDLISQKQKGIYLRFGDGDINLANGHGDMLQKPNDRIKREMQGAFLLNGPNIIKALPIMCRELDSFEEGMFYLNHEVEYKVCLQYLNKTQPLWGQPITDVYSPVALHFAGTQYPELAIEFLKFLRNSNCFMLVGNKDIPPVVRKVLFGDKCHFVPTPTKQAYEAIDAVEQECLTYLDNANPHDYKIIVTSMGCAGRVLQKRLWDRYDNIFLFDFGSMMDAMCGWNTRAWIGLTHFNGVAFLKKLAHSIAQDMQNNNN